MKIDIGQWLFIIGAIAVLVWYIFIHDAEPPCDFRFDDSCPYPVNDRGGN